MNEVCQCGFPLGTLYFSMVYCLLALILGAQGGLRESEVSGEA